MTEIKVAVFKVHLERVDRSGKVTFDGNVEGDRMTGQWEGLGVSASFNLTRTKSQPITFIEEEMRFLKWPQLAADADKLERKKVDFYQLFR